MRILMVAAEFAPFVRTGGLGNAVAGLAGALARAGHDVTAALPRYRELAAGDDEGVPVGAGPWVQLPDSDGVHVLAYDDPPLFDRAGIYGPEPGAAYADNWLRFGRFAEQVAAIANQFDLVHVHDTHPGLVPLLYDGPSVFTIHNAAHPILGPLDEVIATFGLDPEVGAPGGALEWYGQANYLKAALVAADRVTTVSPGHAQELAVDETSFGLGGVVRSLRHPIVGILNGIETDSWDPEADKALAATFSAKKLKRRRANREELLERAGLDDGVVLGNVGRMARQKGLDMLVAHIGSLVDEGCRFVLVGNGELDAMVDEWVQRYPRRVAHLPYSDPLARLVSAGADAYLMPSRFEPCGLGQMYAMRYGAPPIVRFTGGLIDSVTDVDEYPSHGTGLGFRLESPIELVKTIRRAMRYKVGLPRLWQEMQVRGMTTDFSWDARIPAYEEVYRAAVSDHGIDPDILEAADALDA